MNLSLNRPGQYAVLAMIHLSRHDDGGLWKAREIAADVGIPYKSLTQVLATLVNTGLVQALHGPSGGYTLAQRPSEITLLQILEAIEGSVELDSCVLDEDHCEASDPCTVRRAWLGAQAAIVDQFASTTLTDLTGADADIDLRERPAGRR